MKMMARQYSCGPFLYVKDLYKAFGPTVVLKDLSFTLGHGEILGVIGPSGSGKTTLLRCLDLLECQDEGEIEFLHFGAKALPDRRIELTTLQTVPADILRRRIGYVFQTFNLWEERTVLHNVTLAPCVILGEPKAQATARAEVMLDKFGLREKRDSRIWQLSGGQRQRVAIVRALMMNPDILLCDEVTSALDPVLAYDVLQMIRTLRKEGLTMIVVTHHIDFAATLCDRIGYLNNGRFQQIDTPERLLKNPKLPEIENFLNILRVAG